MCREGFNPSVNGVSTAQGRLQDFSMQYGRATLTWLFIKILWI